jgi:hypothetical protein
MTKRGPMKPNATPNTTASRGETPKRCSQAAAILLMSLAFASAAGAAEKVASLCESHYPSDARIESSCLLLKWTDTPKGLFGEQWQDVLRFNRMDRRHFYGGRSIKVPKRMGEIKDFSPMPKTYPSAAAEAKFILVDQTEMFLGAYEYGKLVLSFPAALGVKGHRVPNGNFRIDAVDEHHVSNVYKVEEIGRPYPMHYGLRFFVDKKTEGWETYWIHGRDVPGNPASHGCIGLYDEQMQSDYYSAYDRKVNKSNYHPLEKPYLDAAKKLYLWVRADRTDSGKFHTIKNGPKMQVVGESAL